MSDEPKTIEVDRALLSQLLVDVARSWTALKVLSKVHGKQEAKILLKQATALQDIHQRIITQIYRIGDEDDTLQKTAGRV